MNQNRKQSIAEKERFIEQKIEELTSKKIQLEEAEMGARFYKAQYDIKFYALKNAEIEPEYNAFVQRVIANTQPSEVAAETKEVEVG